MATMPSKQACGLCGADPARGWAKIDDTRYCHGDFDPDPTCYMAAQSQLSLVRTLHEEGLLDGWRIEFAEEES